MLSTGQPLLHLHLHALKLSSGISGGNPTSRLSLSLSHVHLSLSPPPPPSQVWQYITLMKRVLLIDCPGVIYNKAADTEEDAVLKGVVRVENLEGADQYIPGVLRRVKTEYLKRAYQLKGWADEEDFLMQIATKTGKLLKGGEPDLNTGKRMM